MQRGNCLGQAENKPTWPRAALLRVAEAADHLPKMWFSALGCLKHVGSVCEGCESSVFSLNSLLCFLGC